MEIENKNYYKKNPQRTLQDVEKILNSLNLEEKPDLNKFKNLFDKSSDQIINSWKTGKKYSRTIFIQKAFQDKFPEDYLTFSLSIDVMVNILDDFLDENLSKDKKINYVIEFLRNFSFYNYEETPKDLRYSVGLYMSKLITLALSEKTFEKRVKSCSDFNKIVDLSVDLLMLRSMDIEIFTKIGLIGTDNKKEEIIEMSKLFRALNIFKKDIIDIPHDKNNQIETVVTLVLKKDISFSNYSNKISNRIIERADKILDKKNTILFNFYQMIIEDQKEINKLLKKVN